MSYTPDINPLIAIEWTKATGLVPVYNGALSSVSTPIPLGIIADSIGYDSLGSLVYQPFITPADFWRSGTVAAPLLPDGTNDTTDVIVRQGKLGIGTSDPTLVQATLDNFGTFTTRGTIVANVSGIYLISALVANTQAALMITQTTTDCLVSLGTPIGQTAFGRYFRLHNDSTSTNNLIINRRIIQPGTFLDLQWNGTAWAPEEMYTPDGFPRTASQSLGGVISPNATSYNDQIGSENLNVTLPTAIGRRNEIFTINHNSTTDVTLLGTNKNPATSLMLTAQNRITRYISDGVNWTPIDNNSFSGNITAMVSNVLPTAVLPVGGLFEISMPANTDVRIRAIVARPAYITSEGLYNGGSFTTTSNAIVNVTTVPIPADNNTHVAGEMNLIHIHDVGTGRIFRVTVWRLAGIAGNWSGWCEEFGISTNQILTAANPIALSNNQIAYTAPYIRGFGTIAVGDLNTATLVATESSPGITTTITPGGTSAVLTVNMPVGMVPDVSYKVFVTITANAGELGTANASVVYEIAAGRTTNAFRVVLREFFSTVQNCNVEFMIVR